LAKPPKKPQKPRTPRPRAQPPGFREVQQPLDVLTRIHHGYDFACAFTGRNLRAEATADPRGYLLNIGADPLTTEPSLLIPACLDAIHAYERGQLALGPRFNFLVDMETIDPEFLEALNPIGRLSLPQDPALRPNPAALTANLVAFVRGRSPTA
jgi:hypothetical protein